MRGTVGAVLRTVLVVGGLVVALAGIVTLAYPPLLTETVLNDEPTVPSDRGTVVGWGGESLAVSMAGIAAGLFAAAVGLAVPGRSRLRLVPEQRFTRGQRTAVFAGAFFVAGLPFLLGIASRLGYQWLGAALVAGLFVPFGLVLVLYGVVAGLK